MERKGISDKVFKDIYYLVQDNQCSLTKPVAAIFDDVRQDAVP
jgi:hypothetical protein